MTKEAVAQTEEREERSMPMCRDPEVQVQVLPASVSPSFDRVDHDWYCRRCGGLSAPENETCQFCGLPKNAYRLLARSNRITLKEWDVASIEKRAEWLNGGYLISREEAEELRARYIHTREDIVLSENERIKALEDALRELLDAEAGWGSVAYVPGTLERVKAAQARALALLDTTKR